MPLQLELDGVGKESGNVVLHGNPLYLKTKLALVAEPSSSATCLKYWHLKMLWYCACFLCFWFCYICLMFLFFKIFDLLFFSVFFLFLSVFFFRVFSFFFYSVVSFFLLLHPPFFFCVQCQTSFHIALFLVCLFVIEILFCIVFFSHRHV